MRQIAQEVNESIRASRAIANKRWIPFPLSLVGVALQGVLGYAAICIATGYPESVSHHAICQDCHLKERWQPDGKEIEDKMPTRHVS